MNSDLISRSAVIDRLKTKVCNDCYVLKSGGNCGGCFIRAALDMIEDVAAVDAVEVVRCKDCKHYTYGFCELIEYIMDGYYANTFEVRNPDDFCSRGVRKMDAEVQNEKV